MSVFAARHSPSPNAFAAHLPQVIDIARSQSEPVPTWPHGPPEPANREVWVRQIETLANQPDTFTAELESITLKDAEQLQQQFQARGIKFRFDWDAASSTAYVRMPSSLHSTTLGVWVHDVMRDVESQLQKIAPCGKPKLWDTKDSRCELADGSTREPDTGFLVYDGRLSVRPNTAPRVVIEFALTQQLRDVLLKAWKYLFTTKEPYAVHAVVVCNVDNKTGPGGKKFRKLTVDVWVRKATGDIDVDFPMDDCEDDENGPAQAPPRPAAKPGLRGKGETRETQVDASGRMRTVPGEDGTMWRRNKEQIVVYDESLGASQKPLEPLKMDAYDFLRVCRAKPDEVIPGQDRHVFIDLSSLRTVFAVLVQGERDEQRKAHGGQKKEGARPAEGGEASEPVRKRVRAGLQSYEELE
ncbi:hypothetical protein FS749_015704 [Ceratobasidium sp. UAMH 11750]|nr:hypothetical protein FS749_015704 [Ceratobasidium sp. UAMH 11750]